MFKSVLFRVVLLMVLGCGVAGAQIVGQWEAKMTFGPGVTYHDLVIQQGPDGTLSATWNGGPLERVTFANNKLTFTRRVEFGDREMISDFSGTLKDGKIIGVLAADQWDMEVTAVPAKPLCPALGTWIIGFNVMDRDIEAQLVISAQQDGTLAGQWNEEMGEHKVSALKFKDGKLTFTRNSSFNDFAFDTTYEGTINGQALAGKLVGEMGEWQANGQRLGGDFVGQWTLETDSQFGSPTRRLVILPDLGVRYQLFDGLNPLKEVKIDGNKLTAVLEIGFGDQTFEMPFEATLTDGILKGVIRSERGDTHFTGKKQKQTTDAATEAGTQASISPVVGTWENSHTGRDGTPRTTALRIKADMTGTYGFRQVETPLSDLKINDNKVSFKVVLMLRDREFSQEFEGTVEGDSLTGTFTSPRGPREVSFKKVN